MRPWLSQADLIYIASVLALGAVWIGSWPNNGLELWGPSTKVFSGTELGGSALLFSLYHLFHKHLCAIARGLYESNCWPFMVLCQKKTLSSRSCAVNVHLCPLCNVRHW
jgi:hypothetical protein